MSGTAAATPAPATETAAPAAGTLDVLASTAALFVLAVSQPLLSLLGGSPEFFVARDAPVVDIVGLAVILTIIAPLLVGGAVVLIGRIHRGAGVVAHTGVIIALAGVLAVQVIRRTPLDALPGVVQLALGAAAGTALALFYHRSPAFRSVMRWGALVPPLVLGSFLLTSSTSRLIFGAPPPPAAAVTVADPAPVVFLLLDEFPVSSLMDAAGDLQEHLYPNFARLTEDGTWFRNAVTVRDQTQFATPAILTGLVPEGDEMPTLDDYPDNLFTLLAGTYDIDSTEIVTRLCPDTCRSHDVAVPVRMRWRALLDDLSVVAGHTLLPADLASGLPPIDSGWGNFAAGNAGADPGSGAFSEWFSGTIQADRRQPVDAFLERLGDGSGTRPTLHFMHALLPHSPWTYLPSGQQLDVPVRSPARARRGWVDDTWLVDQAYQLHLLQVQYVDAVVGDVIDRLEELGTYDDTLLVIVADHGIVVRPGPLRRGATPDNVGEIPPVPLFIKAPHQESGGIDDYRAETPDIVPTVADILGIDLPWEADGASLVAAARPERTGSVITGEDGPVPFGADGEGARERAAAKVARFGGNGPFGLAPEGYADLLGTPGDVVAPGASTVRARIDSPDGWDEVDTSAPTLPAYIQGRIEEAGEPVVLAVSVNGEIVAVTRSYVDRRGVTRFDAAIPPDSLVDGPNRVELLEVVGEGAGRTLLALPSG